METDRPVRVRIAPGPTGPFHIGRSRTALINWLFARHFGGTFILRIEDTDQKRSKPEHLTSILQSLRWLGLDWDEGPDVGGPYEPYFQMGRLQTYRDHARQLLDSGHAYYCYCTPDELALQRKAAESEKRAYRYPRTCRHLTRQQQLSWEAEGRRPVIRIATPLDGDTAFDDLVVGHVTVRNSELDDFIIMRPDAMPLYNFAVVVDDSTMDISHVIRGQDHVPNTPRQVLMYHFLQKPVPVFAHLPMVLGMDRGKISARHGAEPVTMYGNDGYLPEALVNYLATIGIAYDGEREIFSPEELIALFDIGKLSKSGAAFSEEKLEWMNGVYLRTLDVHEFVRRSLPFLQQRSLVASPPSPQEVEYATAALRLEQERVRTLAQTPDIIAFFFEDELVYDPALLVQRKSNLADTVAVLDACLQSLQGVLDAGWRHDALETKLRDLTEKLQLKTGTVFGAVRVAITGRTAAPPLFDTMVVLGRDRVLKRLRVARSKLDHLEHSTTPLS